MAVFEPFSKNYNQEFAFQVAGREEIKIMWNNEGLVKTLEKYEM